MQRLILIAVVILAVRPARAQFTVFDPANYGQAVANVRQGVQTYMQILQAYQLAQQMAQAMRNLPNQYRYLLLSQWAAMNPASPCRGCQVWTGAANTGVPVNDTTYGGAVSPLYDYSRMAGLLTPDAQAQLQARLANAVYLPQAAVNNDLAALGMARTNDPIMQSYVQQCQSDVINSNFTSQIQTAQAGNACQMVQQQQQNLANNMLGRLVDHASIDAARQIDEQTNALNSRLAKAALYDSVRDQTMGIDAAFANWGHN